MSAGTGIRHSEFNSSNDEPVHLLQIWLLPQRQGLSPGYEQKAVNTPAGRLGLIASQDGRDGSVTIHQAADLYRAALRPGDAVSHTLASNRHAWLHLARGSATVNGHPLSAGDAAAVSDEARLDIRADGDAELLLFDLG